MITTELHKLTLIEVRNLYKEYLVANGKGQSTVQTYTSDTFYLWNKVSKEAFWKVVCSDDFDTKAKTALHEALTKNSSGQVDDLVVGYVAVLKMFRAFVTEYDGVVCSLDSTCCTRFRTCLTRPSTVLAKRITCCLNRLSRIRSITASPSSFTRRTYGLLRLQVLLCCSVSVTHLIV